jgi:hypothetical protein
MQDPHINAGASILSSIGGSIMIDQSKDQQVIHRNSAPEKKSKHVMSLKATEIKLQDSGKDQMVLKKMVRGSQTHKNIQKKKR